MYEEEESWRPKVLRGLGKTAIVLLAIVGVLWALDRESPFADACLVLATCYVWWSALFGLSDEITRGAAFVYGKDALITQRPVAIFFGHSLEYAYGRAEAYVRMRQQLAGKNERHAMPPDGLIVSDKAIVNAADSIRVWAMKALFLVVFVGVLYLAISDQWLFALLALGAYLSWLRYARGNSGWAYVYMRHNDGPVAGFISFSKDRALNLAQEYVDQCKAAADAGVLAKPDAELWALYEPALRRGSKDWPWPDDKAPRQ